MGDPKLYDESYVKVVFDTMQRTIAAKKNDVETIRNRFSEERRVIKEGMLKIVATFNEARARAYKALPPKQQKIGDFDSMETRACIEDKPGQPLRILLTGVWGSVGMKIEHKPDGTYSVKASGTDIWVTRDIDGVLEMMGEDLATDHPDYREACGREAEAKKEFAK